MEPRGDDPAWLFWLSFAGLAALIAGAILTAPMVARLAISGAFEAPTPAEDAGELERNAGLEAGAIITAMRANFPDEYRNYRKALTQDDVALLERPKPSPLEETIAFGEQAFARHRSELAAAPHDEIMGFRDAQIALVERLEAVAPGQCAQYLSNGMLLVTPSDPETRKLLTGVHVHFWNAAGAGRYRPAQGRLGIVDGPAATAFDDAMLAEGVSDEELRYLNRLDEMDEEQQCDIGLKRLRALRRLPEAVGDRIYANLLMGNI